MPLTPGRPAARSRNAVAHTALGTRRRGQGPPSSQAAPVAIAGLAGCLLAGTVCTLPAAPGAPPTRPPWGGSGDHSPCADGPWGSRSTRSTAARTSGTPQERTCPSPQATRLGRHPSSPLSTVPPGLHFPLCSEEAGSSAPQLLTRRVQNQAARGLPFSRGPERGLTPGRVGGSGGTVCTWRGWGEWTGKSCRIARSPDLCGVLGARTPCRRDRATLLRAQAGTSSRPRVTWRSFWGLFCACL